MGPLWFIVLDFVNIVGYISLLCSCVMNAVGYEAYVWQAARGSCLFWQVQCHSYTGYCWCVTPNGRPISGTAVAHKTPRCPGKSCLAGQVVRQYVMNSRVYLWHLIRLKQKKFFAGRVVQPRNRWWWELWMPHPWVLVKFNWRRLWGSWSNFSCSCAWSLRSLPP